MAIQKNEYLSKIIFALQAIWRFGLHILKLVFYLKKFIAVDKIYDRVSIVAATFFPYIIISE